jgi:hypothetical protein
MTGMPILGKMSVAVRIADREPNDGCHGFKPAIEPLRQLIVAQARRRIAIALAWAVNALADIGADCCSAASHSLDLVAK